MGQMKRKEFQEKYSVELTDKEWEVVDYVIFCHPLFKSQEQIDRAMTQGHGMLLALYQSADEYRWISKRIAELEVKLKNEKAKRKRFLELFHLTDEEQF
jgi:hypothetical protein